MWRCPYGEAFSRRPMVGCGGVAELGCCLTCEERMSSNQAHGWQRHQILRPLNLPCGFTFARSARMRIESV